MRMLKFLLQKEFRQVFRNPSVLRLIFVMPVVQLLILPWAADYEVKNIRLAIVDNDHSDYSRQFISKVTASGYFRLDQFANSYKNALQEIEKDKADIIVQIPVHFEKNLVKESKASLFLAVNAINGVKATLGAAYSRVDQHWSSLRDLHSSKSL